MDNEAIRLAYQKAHLAEPPEACLTAEQLVRLATAEASQAERLRAADHLIVCTRCSEEYRLLTSLEPWADESAVVLDPSGARPRTVRTTSPIFAYATAAGLLLSFALGSWVGKAWGSRADSGAATPDRAAPEAVAKLADADRQLAELRRRADDQERQLAELRQAQEVNPTAEPNVPIVDLEPGDALRSERSRTRVIQLPSAARSVTFVINTAQNLPPGGYSADMTDARGRVVWDSSGLKPSADATFTIAVPRRLLPEGEAHLRLYSRRAGARAVIEDYAVRFAYR